MHKRAKIFFIREKYVLLSRHKLHLINFLRLQFRFFATEQFSFGVSGAKLIGIVYFS